MLLTFIPYLKHYVELAIFYQSDSMGKYQSKLGKYSKGDSTSFSLPSQSWVIFLLNGYVFRQEAK